MAATTRIYTDCALTLFVGSGTFWSRQEHQSAASLLIVLLFRNVDGASKLSVWCNATRMHQPPFAPLRRIISLWEFIHFVLAMGVGMGGQPL